MISAYTHKTATWQALSSCYGWLDVCNLDTDNDKDVVAAGTQHNTTQYTHTSYTQQKPILNCIGWDNLHADMCICI